MHIDLREPKMVIKGNSQKKMRYTPNFRSNKARIMIILINDFVINYKMHFGEYFGQCVRARTFYCIGVRFRAAGGGGACGAAVVRTVPLCRARKFTLRGGFEGLEL